MYHCYYIPMLWKIAALFFPTRYAVQCTISLSIRVYLTFDLGTQKIITLKTQIRQSWKSMSTEFIKKYLSFFFKYIKLEHAWIDKWLSFKQWMSWCFFPAIINQIINLNEAFPIMDKLTHDKQHQPNRLEFIKPRISQNTFYSHINSILLVCIHEMSLITV